MHSSFESIRRRTLLSLAGATTLAVLCGVMHVDAHAQAAAYPSRPIKIIVPFPAGTGTDGTARVFAKK
ncbi:MAG: hypothetical protein V7642_4668, partial [Burkholderiales bacterium]